MPEEVLESVLHLPSPETCSRPGISAFVMILDGRNGPHEVLEHRHVVWLVLRVSPEVNVRSRWFKVAYLVDQSKYQSMKFV